MANSISDTYTAGYSSDPIVLAAKAEMTPGADSSGDHGPRPNAASEFIDCRQCIDFEGENDFSYKAYEWLILL